MFRVNSPEGLNLRAGPGADQRVLTVIPHNTRLPVGTRSPDGRWVQVTFASQNGWVDSQYLVPAGAEERPSPPPNPGAEAGTAKFIWPVANRSVTTRFGPSHPGIDVDEFPSGGNPVVATAAGKVVFAGGNPCCSYGLNVRVEHPGGAMSLYAHLATVEVREGQEVAQGQRLGLSGNTGFSTGAHLHFELHIGGSPVDPMGQLPQGGSR